MFGRCLSIATAILLAVVGVAARAVTPTACPTISMAPATALPSPALQVAFGQTFTASGSSDTPYAYAVTSGLPLPSGYGLSLDPSSGILSGTLTQGGNFLVTITATDAHGCSGGRTYALNVVPAVLSTVPTNSATAVAPNSTVTINFSEAVNVGASAFTLQCPSGTPVTFTQNPAAPGNATSFTLTPAANMPPATTCTGTVGAVQVASASDGDQMAADYSFSFTTATLPAVTTTTPANNANNVVTASTITLTFNESVNAPTGAFTLACPSGTPEAFTTSSSPATSFMLTPSASLPAGTVCTVTAAAEQITDAATSTLHPSADYMFSFTVDSAPTVIGTGPANGATSAPLSSTVSFAFNEAVNVTASAFTLQCPNGTPVVFTLSPAPPGGATTFTLTPSGNLSAGATCSATAAASQIADLAGTHLATDFNISFTTDTPPSVVSMTPANGATSVPGSAMITINFDRAVNVTASAFTLQCPTGAPKSFTMNPAPPGGGTSFALIPSTNLPAGTVCTTSVIANQVTDVSAGTAMTANFTFTFTTDSAPTVISTNPASGAITVLDTSTVAFTFSKAVNVTPSAFTLQCPIGTPIAFTLTPAPPGGATTFTLTPSANMPPNVTCSASTVASQIADVVGTNLSTSDTISFSTVPPPPVANNDSYPETIIGNVGVNSAQIPYSVTTNDTSQSAFTITAFDATSVNGGTVSMTTSGAGIGQFTYNPPAGFTGTDTFTYTITNTGGSSTAAVSIPVSGMIWFINNAAAAGNGTLASPFNTLGAFQAVNDGVGQHPAVNANIFVYDSASNYIGPLTLLNGQKLLGQDATSSLAAMSGLTPGVSSAELPATGGGSPNSVTITSGGNSVTLGSGNTVWGMTLGNSTGTALTGASVGSLKIRDFTVNTTGAATSLANGALDAIFNAVSSGGGTHGISLTTTTGSFDIEGDGASDPTNKSKGRTTAKNGGGTLTLGSGGTVQNATSAGILLSAATNVTLRNITIQNNGGTGINNGGDGINASGSSNLTLDNDLITGQTGNSGLFANTLANLAIQHSQISSNATNAGDVAPQVWNVEFGVPTCVSACANGLTGLSTVANSIFDATTGNAFGLTNFNSSALSLTVTNSQFSNSGNAGLISETFDTSNVSLSVDGSSVHNNPAGGVLYDGNESSGGGTIAVTNSTFDQNGAESGADINIAHEGADKTITFNISGNTTRQSAVPNSAISIGIDLGGTSTSTTVMQGTINNNVVGNSSVGDSGSLLSSGIGLQTSGPGTITASISGNTVVQTDDDGLLVLASSATSSTINVTATNNSFSVSATDPNTNLGVELTAGGDGGSDVICANINANIREFGNSEVAGIATEVLGTSTVELQGYGGAANNNAQIASFLNGTATNVSPAALNFGGGGTVKASPAPCPTPQ